MSTANLWSVDTSGASLETASQDGIKYDGVHASNKLAEPDRGRVEEYKSYILKAAKKHNVHPAIIAGIMSRESRVGAGLDSRGYGDYGKAFGIMQIDITKKGGNHKPVGGPYSYEHIDQATGILVYFIKRIGEKFPNWSEEMKLKGGIAAYNKGDGAIHSYERVDENTTGKDYSNDVVARAKWFDAHIKF